jgi:hypothetical protein
MTSMELDRIDMNLGGFVVRLVAVTRDGTETSSRGPEERFAVSIETPNSPRGPLVNFSHEFSSVGEARGAMNLVVVAMRLGLPKPKDEDQGTESGG